MLRVPVSIRNSRYVGFSEVLKIPRSLELVLFGEDLVQFCFNILESHLEIQQQINNSEDFDHDVCTLLFKFFEMLSCLFLFNLSSKYASADNLVSSLFTFSSAYHWHYPCHLMPHDLSVSSTTHPVCAVSFLCCPEQNEDEVQNAYTLPGKYRDLVMVTVCDDSLSILLFFLLALKGIITNM